MQIHSDPVLDAALNAQRLESEISTRVAKKTLDASKAEGDAAVALIQSAVELGRSTVSGDGRVDVLA